MTVQRWRRRLASCAGDRHVIVLEETDSTQDAVRRHGAAPGLIVAARRQVGGRGRLGRAWADTGHDGLAISFALAAAPVERMAIGCAVATARALESLPGGPVLGLKWPNDVVWADGRKVAGILIEQAGGIAVVGVGVNVAHEHFAPHLQQRAVSLSQLGCRTDRLEVAAALVREMALWPLQPDDALCEAFGHRDVLCGRQATFRQAGGGPATITGTVLSVDPMQGLRVLADRQEVWLPAATTTVVSWDPAASGANHGSRAGL